MSFKYLPVLVFIFFMPFHILGQMLSGKIIDDFKEPVIGAQLFNESDMTHTHTDYDGTFTFDKVNVGDVLRITHIGYESKSITVNSISELLKIELKSSTISLKEVVISPKLNALNIITDINLRTNFVNSSQDVLRKVPGLFIGQHAGGGKAEQIFLRGFDIDHGTDITISVDGLPVNMVSHAHGQGYADLHFLIPETIKNIDFGKGAYYGNQGNFNTAGYVNFKTLHALKTNALKMELGQFNTQRVVGMFNVVNNDNHQSYFATEYINSDGPFDSPQNFNRINVFGKYSGKISNSDKIGMTVSHFTSDWDASGQIPVRSVHNKTIGRFGAIDDTEGGRTSRTNVLLNHQKFTTANSFIKSAIFYSKYDFELYSNFTFFLEDPINGDQIRQNESRDIFGMNSEYFRSTGTDWLDVNYQFGFQLRTDRIRENELSHTLNRKETLNQIRLGDVNEMNIGFYSNANLEFGRWIINPSIRLDFFDFEYIDALNGIYDRPATNQAIISPKLNILHNYSDNLQLYFKSGKGFHSNDARVVIAQAGEKTLPASYGMDAGFIWKPSPPLLVNTAFWYLFLEQEFVYVGDAGIVEPSGKTIRQGVDVSIRYQPLSWLLWNFDANYTLARSSEAEIGENYIPLAPDFTLGSGLQVLHSSGLYGGINVRHIDNRPANENNSIIAEGYTIVDFNAGYNWNSISLGLQIQNLFNTAWNETQFSTESRLFNEPAAIEEIHFTPGSPFFLKGIVEYKF